MIGSMDTGNSGNVIKVFLESTAWKMEAPAIGSAFHIFAVLAVALAAVLAAVKVSRVGSDSFRIKILSVLGWVLLAGEVYKQLFYYFIVNDGVYDWWFFPFQLCSVPMYMCILLPFFCSSKNTDGKTACDLNTVDENMCKQTACDLNTAGDAAKCDLRGIIYESMLTFMCCFTFVSAVVALIWPEDMLRPYVTLTWHGFIWHGILLFISVMIGLSGMADLTFKGFLRAVLLFLILCAAAITINVLAEPIAASHPLSPGLTSYPDMFYLSPYHVSLQPFVMQIGTAFGRPAAMATYIFSIILLAWIADRIFSHLSSISPHQ